ncbi:MAG: redox-sensing transcriptional repressor Rex [Chloroflexi bacterium]|nr:MAG: redox-sensing transcriptional repressor Rex [Chloroflexota bacterium]
MPSTSVPDIVVGRLPIYLRALSFMAAEGREITSSQELGERLGISSAQIRKDLSHFGEFGKQGTGYNVAYLREQLRRILKVDREWEVALIGAGALGHALAHYGGFRNRGFHIALIFDSDPAKVGQVLGGIEVLDAAQMEDVIRGRGVQIAMIAVPAEAAQEVADRCVKAGVRAILNYAPINIAVPEGVRVEYIDPVVHLQHMTYYLD